MLPDEDDVVHALRIGQHGELATLAAQLIGGRLAISPQEGEAAEGEKTEVVRGQDVDFIEVHLRMRTRLSVNREARFALYYSNDRREEDT